MIIHVKKTVKAEQCQKCRKNFKKKQTSQNMCNQGTYFLVPVWRFQHFRHILQNPKLKLMATSFSNHSLDLNLWALSKDNVSLTGTYLTYFQRVFNRPGVAGAV